MSRDVMHGHGSDNAQIDEKITIPEQYAFGKKVKFA
jgi:hypothetical protein